MDKGEKVKKFYDKNPFPDFELNKFNSKEDLKLAAFPFAKILDRSIPENASIIDIGTGTGQLSAFLSLKRKNVFGTDFSETSLNKARALKEKLKLDSLTLKKVDLMNEKEIENIEMKFDCLLCLGVLHHTENPYQGFQNILKLLKPKGFLAIGLYNKFGRVPLKIRRVLAKTVFKNNTKMKEKFIKMQLENLKDEKKVKGWWNDQYFHPVESSHSLGEVLNWFKKNDIEFYQTIPSSNPFNQENTEIAGVWNKFNESYPSLPVRFYKELTWVWRTQKEGGYWITFGRKRK